MNKNNNKSNGIFLIIFSICFFGIFISIFITMISSIGFFGNIAAFIPIMFMGIVFVFGFIKMLTTGIKTIKNPDNTNLDPTMSYKVQEVKEEKSIIKYCEICGNELEEKDAFCSSCGCKIRK